MSNELRALLDRVAATDPDTAKELRRHVDALQSRREFGLNFERHTPESVDLAGRPISVGDKVRFLPPRGEAEVESKAIWIVTGISGKHKRVAQLVDPHTQETSSRDLDDLVFVADFRDAIYPGLIRSGEAIVRGGDKPFHTVINAENFHALETLMYTHEARVDCIYIDPPYNTRDNDWKYNNDYVDPGDSYAHSKWLAFMERRLRVAKRLLNPDESVLIVTIDEKEYLRLGLLLEQTFPSADIQMVSSMTNKKGSSRPGRFSRADEYLFFVFFGAARVIPTGDNMLSSSKAKAKTIWNSLLRRGDDAARQDRPNMFYPVWVDRETEQIASIGDPPPLEQDRNSVVPPRAGLHACWPIRSDGSEGRWQTGAPRMRELLALGYAKRGAWNKVHDQWAVLFLKSGQIKSVENGDLISLGRPGDGPHVLRWAASVEDSQSTAAPRTLWVQDSHDASVYGSTLLKKFLPGQKFPFPKSLYAVEDALRFVIGDKPDALILDFFAGSGTTAHAVMRLNKQDNGRRYSISVTNNEVNDLEDALLGQGLRCGDFAWDEQGICERVTKPRISAAVLGRTQSGLPVEGEYAYTDPFPMSEGFEENVDFFTLTYENNAVVEIDMAFERIAPLLWLKSGATGRIIEQRSATYDLTERYGVLFSVDAAGDFLDAVAMTDGLQMAFIVTNDESMYQAIAVQLPRHVQPVRLYESYLRTFEINNGRV